MFSRIRETYRILTYHDHGGPDAVIVPESITPEPKTSRAISNTIEITVVAMVAGYGSGKILYALHTLTGKPSVYSATLTGAVAVLLFIVYEMLTGHLQALLKQKLALGERLAPFFGHKLDETFRVLRG